MIAWPIKEAFFHEIKNPSTVKKQKTVKRYIFTFLGNPQVSSQDSNIQVAEADMELEGIISLLSFYFISPLQSAQNVKNCRHNLGLVNLCLRSKICKNILVIHVCMNVASIV